jgi:protein-disulfide isomerase
MKRLLIIAVLTITTALPLAAQQDDYFERYEDIPHARTADGGFVLGEESAPITLVEFADFMCPHCQSYRETVHQFIDEYVAKGLARFEYRFYPVVHPTYSVFTAQLAECTEVQRDGAFWAAHDLLYDLAADGAIGPDTPEALAEALNLSAEKLETCAEAATQHETDAAIAQAMGANGTPATMLRLPDETLGWAYVQNRIRHIGGMPSTLLRQIMESADYTALVVAPQPLLGDLVTAEAACDVPCWRTIVPGETPITKVAELIRADRQNIEIAVDTLQDGSEAVSWKTFDSDLNESNTIVGGADGTVEAISLIDIADFGLGDVVESHGEPDYAVAVPTSSDAVLFYAIYAEEAMIVLGFVTSDTGLSDDTLVVGVQLYSPSAMDDLLSTPGLAAWNGYDALDDYYRE